MDWISFYDFKHSVIYVNGRHRDVHYETIAMDIRALVPSPAAVVMDYGCGEATSAALVADACKHLTLVEAAPNVRAALRERFASNPKMSVMTPDEAAAQPAGSVDMIVLHSVAQYLTAAELDAMMATFKRLLKPAGQRIFLGGGRRPHSHSAVGLFYAQKVARPVALHRGRHAGETARGRLCAQERRAQYRP